MKSLIARIEFNNTLAPIQEYGRHQKRAAANIKKKNKKKPAAATGGPGSTAVPGEAASDEPSEIGGAKMDENYYDLDDDFIDDGELESIDQDDDMLLYGDGETSKF